MMICRSGKRAARVEQHRVRQAQQQAASARQPRTDAGLAGVEERDDSGVLQRLVQREVGLVRRVEAWDGRVELEAAHAVVVEEPAHPLDGVGTARIDRAEGMSTSLLRCAPSAISALESGEWLSWVSASTVNTTAAMRRSR